MGRKEFFFLMLSKNDKINYSYLLLCCIIYLGVFINYYDLWGRQGGGPWVIFKSPVVTLVFIKEIDMPKSPKV